MDSIQYTRYAQNFLKMAYNIPLTIPVKINNRLSSTYGRFIIKNQHPHAIEIAGFVIQYGHMDIIQDILRHECIHYALFVKKLPYKDKDKVFKAELLKHKTSRTRTFKIGKYYYFACEKCAQSIASQSKRLVSQTENYLSKCCRAKLIPKGYKIFHGRAKS